MPKSGPGRVSQRRGTLNKTKKTIKGVIMEHRRPSIVALEPVSASIGSVPVDDVYVLSQLANEVK